MAKASRTLPLSVGGAHEGGEDDGDDDDAEVEVSLAVKDAKILGDGLDADGAEEPGETIPQRLRHARGGHPVGVARVTLRADRRATLLAVGGRLGVRSLEVVRHGRAPSQPSAHAKFLTKWPSVHDGTSARMG